MSTGFICQNMTNRQTDSHGADHRDVRSLGKRQDKLAAGNLRAWMKGSHEVVGWQLSVLRYYSCALHDLESYLTTTLIYKMQTLLDCFISIG